MLSEKMTLSLTSLVVLLAFGLICFVPTASAHDDKTKTANEFNVKLVAAESMMDVSYRGDGADDNIQIMRQATDTETTISLLARFDVVVNLTDPTDASRLGTAVETDVEDLKDAAFQGKDIIIDAYDEDGRALGLLPFTEANDVVELRHRDPNNPGKEFLILIDESELSDAYSNIHSGGPFAIATLLVSIPEGAVQDATLAEVLKLRKGEHFPHSNKRSNVFQVHFVSDDAGLAKHSSLAATPVAVTEGVPGVVSIDRILDRSGFAPIETGPFNVRVILTEEPRMGDKSGLTTDMIMVEGGGSATAVTAGLTYDGGARTVGGTITPAGDDNAGSELTLAMLGDYHTANAADPDAPTAATAQTALPNATGRDNKYYTYSVTITPNAGVNGDLIISIKQFMDHVKPVSRMYLPLTPEQRDATTLVAAASAERYARIANETITVRVNTAADTTSKAAVAKAAYDKRKTDVFDKITNEIVLANRTYIPAGGFLVLAADLDKAGIQKSDVKTKDKTGPELLYNTHGLGLPFPANDLDNFFRNGGTLNLAYADIPEATGSDHGDSKGATGDDATGYDKANSTAYAAGALIINEIMWGLNGGADPETGSQYIELHNPGTTAIGIDNMEWIITVGSVPAGFTVIDSAGNNPATGFWEVPGSGGVTKADPANPVVTDLVSMSRVTGSADGTAEASWVESERPSANLSGRRIGTPGAANSYDMPETMEEEMDDEMEEEMMAPPATASDIMISEIMIASNDGRLPQWIELANVSGSAVSLDGWSLEIENDAADTDVVASEIEIDLSGLEIGEDQVALVVSKSGRTSGIGTGEGDLREDRILDVQAVVSADNARYSLISEMGFMLTLMPPKAAGSAIRMAGDSGGNLGMEWEIPMSEDGRSSLIRREMGDAGEIMGSDAAGWVLASSTSLSGAYRTTYYGSDEDMGTPGYNAGGALPVELSGFYPKRNEETGHVEITWKTQSELNNAGFFIKRSQQRDGKFVVVNPTMIPGAGTTSEEQSYTYTDTTAQPNVIYYYQIEDVSLDGQRQTLTLGTRLRGHIGAAGKATTIWGELKSQE